MYTVSATYNAILSDELHWYETQVKINDVAYSQSQIMEMSVNYRQFTEEYPVAGGCLSAELFLKMLTPSVQIPRMAKVEPFARITNGTLTSEWIPQGVFYIDTREQSQNDDNLPVMTLHCYDSMLKAEANYPETTHAWPCTDIDVVNEIATAMGVSVDARTTALMTHGYSISLPAGYTMRETLGYIAAMYAGNFVMSYDGELLLIGLNSLPPETNYLIDNAGFAITFGRGATEHTASGGVLSFDGDGSSLEEFTVDINPVQNLNGYDAPWPAGGGVNKLVYPYSDPNGPTRTGNNVTYSVNSDGSIKITTSDAASGNADYYLVGTNSSTYQDAHIASGTYIVSLSADGSFTGAIRFYVVEEGQNILGNARVGYPVTVTIDATKTYRLLIRTVTGATANATFYPMIRSSTVSSETWMPYSNICPISGWSGMNILRSGINLFDKTTATLGKCISGSGGITNRSGTDAFYSDYIPIHAEVGMKFRHTAPGVSGKTMRIVLYDNNKRWMRGEATPSAGGNTCAITISQSDVDAGAAYLRISAYSAGVYNYAMCTVGNDVVQNYTRYIGTIYPVSWQSEAGTVYGGTLDVNTGVLTVDRGIVTFDGSNDESWNFGLSSGIYRAYIAVADIDTSAGDTSVLNLLCNEFKAGSYSGRGENSVTGRNGIAQLNFFQNTYTTIDEWTAFLADSPATVVYPLAVPMTYQLTAQEVNTLAGINNISADTGDSHIAYSYGGEVTRILV